MSKYIIILSAIFAVVCAEAKVEAIRGTSKTDGEPAPVVRNADGKKLSAKIEFDIGGLPEKVAAARLELVCKIKGKELSNPSIVFAHEGNAIATYTLLGAGKTQATRVNVADIVKKAAARGEKTLSFKAYSIAPDGATNGAYIENTTLYVADADDAYDFNEFMTPIFSGGKMLGESVFPMFDKNGVAKSRLLYAPKKILRAYTYLNLRKEELAEGTDFKVEGDTVKFARNGKFKPIEYSKIFAATKEEAKKNGRSFYFENMGAYAFFEEGDWFHRHQVYFDYEYDAEPAFKFAKPTPESLAKSRKRLAEGKPLKIVLYGDSIAYGANSPAIFDCPPFSPTWADTIAMELRRRFKGRIFLANRSLGGTTISWGARNLENLVLPDKPDLLIIAFGMNDSCAPEKRKEWLVEMMSKTRAQNPDAEFIIVSSICANPMWRKSFAVHDQYPKFDKSLESPTVAIADVRGAHKALLAKKRYIDTTGNNVNHPNQFLARVYAQAILNCLDAQK